MSTTANWWLDDAEAKNAEAPSSFFIPSAAKRHSLVPGDRVKLHFGFDSTPEGWNGERMWVRGDVGSRATYVGRLLNQPEHIDTLAAGSEIEFGPHHVAAYDWDPAELGYDASQHAWASKEVLRGPDHPALVTMRPPENISDESDSGWTVGNGYEPDAGPTHFEWSPVGSLTDRFPELELIFRAGGGNWRWDPQQGVSIPAASMAPRSPAAFAAVNFEGFFGGRECAAPRLSAAAAEAGISSAVEVSDLINFLSRGSHG